MIFKERKKESKKERKKEQRLNFKESVILKEKVSEVTQ